MGLSPKHKPRAGQGHSLDVCPRRLFVNTCSFNKKGTGTYRFYSLEWPKSQYRLDISYFMH